MNRERISEILAAFSGKRILVIGDLMLDEFLWGKVSRISPEAPVPVVEIVREESFPGGAANVARNLAEFTAHVRIMGVTGHCQHADHLKRLLKKDGINIDSVQSHDCYQTIVKTRIIARQQHMVRIDREKKLRLRAEHASIALGEIEALLPEIDAIVVEDYGKGMLAQEFAKEICALANRAGKILAVDPNPHNPPRLAARVGDQAQPGRGVLRARACRLKSPSILPKRTPRFSKPDASFRRSGIRTICLSRSASKACCCSGATLRPTMRRPARGRFSDVSGAGDTVIALFTLALSAGAAPQEGR